MLESTPVVTVVTNISYAPFFSVLVEYVLVDYFSGTDGGGTGPVLVVLLIILSPSPPIPKRWTVG